MSLSQWSARWLNDILPYSVKCPYDILPCARRVVHAESLIVIFLLGQSVLLSLSSCPMNFFIMVILAKAINVQSPTLSPPPSLSHFGMTVNDFYVLCLLVRTLPFVAGLNCMSCFSHWKCFFSQLYFILPWVYQRGMQDMVPFLFIVITCYNSQVTLDVHV